jgi:hypothetical protein
MLAMLAGGFQPACLGIRLRAAAANRMEPCAAANVIC